MKKGLLKLLVISILIFTYCFFGQTVNASSEQDDEESGWRAEYEALLESSGANELFGILPEDAGEILQKSGIDGVDSEQLMNISFFDLAKTMFSSVMENLKMPVTMLFICIGVILLCALLNSMGSSFQEGGYDRAFSVMSIICVSGAVMPPMASLIIRSSEVIKQASGFLLSFVPVYVGIVSASGKPLSATAYSTAIIGVVQIISRVCATVFVPLLGIYLAFCLIGSASHEIDAASIAKAVKNVVVVAFSFMLTIFVGLLSIQGVIANSADTLTMKTAKFAISSFLPVVGSAVSEALNSVQGCVGVIKTTVGGFGIFGVAAVFLPNIITILLMQLSLFIAGGVSEALGTTRLTKLMEATRSVMSLLLGIMVIFAVMFIISIGIMLAISTA